MNSFERRLLLPANAGRLEVSLQDIAILLQETLERFGSGWEGLDDPSCGNANLHDFHELLMIVLCRVLGGSQGAVDMAVFGTRKSVFYAAFSRRPTACLKAVSSMAWQLRPTS